MGSSQPSPGLSHCLHNTFRIQPARGCMQNKEELRLVTLESEKQPGLPTPHLPRRHRGGKFSADFNYEDQGDLEGKTLAFVSDFCAFPLWILAAPASHTTHPPSSLLDDSWLWGLMSAGWSPCNPPALWGPVEPFLGLDWMYRPPKGGNTPPDCSLGAHRAQGTHCSIVQAILAGQGPVLPWLSHVFFKPHHL